jgi:hypothetical protein
VEGEITEDEIVKYYEENKDPLFIKADTTLIDAPPANPQSEAPADDAATQTTPDTETNAAAESSAEPQSDAQTTTDLPADTDQSAPAEPATSEAEPPADTPETGNEPGQNDQSRLRPPRKAMVFRLAAFAQEAAQEAEGEQPVSETSSSPAADATNPTSDTSSSPAGAPAAGAEQPPATSPSGDAPAATTTATETPGSGPTAGEGESTTSAASAASEKPKEFQPLDEVRDVIRRRLAEQRVNEQLSDLMGQLHSRVSGEFTKYFGARLEAERDQRIAPAPPPSLVDLAPLAEQHGLQHGRTGPIGWLEMRQTPVGESGDIETRRPLFQELFASEDLDLYQPVSTQDVNANRYLAMKMSDTPGRVPALSEVHDEVVRAWKQRKAAELAQKHADDLAKKAQQAKGTLSDFFANDQAVEVIRTDPFARLTAGDVTLVQGRPQQQPFRLSEPDGVVAAGPAFMDKVFALKDGEVGAVLNHDQSIAYVLRVAEHQLAPDELRNAYLSEANIWPGIGYMMNDHAQQAMHRLANDIRTTAGLEWERDPDQLRTTDEEPEEAEQAEEPE